MKATALQICQMISIERTGQIDASMKYFVRTLRALVRNSWIETAGGAFQLTDAGREACGESLRRNCSCTPHPALGHADACLYAGMSV